VHRIATADYDSDGIPEVVVLGENGEAWYYDQGMTAASPLGFPTAFSVPVDVTATTTLEDAQSQASPLAVGAPGEIHVYGYQGGFFCLNTLMGAPEEIRSLYGTDLDGDGMDDLVVANEDQDLDSYIQFLMPTGMGGSCIGLPLDSQVASGGDFDGDGDPEAAFLDEADGIVTVSFLPEFIRGDANQDGDVNVADPIFILAWLFPAPGMTPSLPPLCHDSADTNDDGIVNIADAMAIFRFLFPPAGSAPFSIPAPYPLPGMDPTLDDLPCGTGACP